MDALIIGMLVLIAIMALTNIGLLYKVLSLHDDIKFKKEKERLERIAKDERRNDEK